MEKFQSTRDPRYITNWYWGWEPHPKQRQWLEAFDGGYNEMFLTTGNRFGKSEVAGVMLMLTAMLNPSDELHVLNASITQDQAAIVWGFCERLCINSPKFEHWVADIVSSPFPTITLAHGSQIWARSTQYDCKYIEGHKFRVANYDEIAHGTQAGLDVLKMRVADCNGTVSGTTTPKRKNWYWRECWRPAELEVKTAKADGRKPTAYVLAGSSYDNPHISHKYLDNVRLTEKQRQEKIHGLFVEGDGVFRAEDIEAITDADLNDRLEEYDRPMSVPDLSAGKVAGTWVQGWDLAKAEDWTVCCGLDRSKTPWELRYFKRYQREPWPNVEKDIKHSQERFNADGLFDATGVGAVTEDYLDVPIWRLEPFKFTAKSKTELINNLVWCIENRKLKIPFIQQLINELYDYEWKDAGLTTDCVMALALACWKANEGGRPMEVY